MAATGETAQQVPVDDERLQRLRYRKALARKKRKEREAVMLASIWRRLPAAAFLGLA